MKSDRESGNKPALINARHQAHVLRSLAQMFRLALAILGAKPSKLGAGSGYVM